MIRGQLVEEIKKDEHFEPFPYPCPSGKLTIGYGRNIQDNGISESEANYLLANDVNRSIIEALEIFPNLYQYSENRQRALVNMIFNMGKTRFLEFKKMIAAVLREDWEQTSAEAKDSKWHSQVGKRAIRIEKMLLEG